ncbi:hypothetical protein [Roseibium sp.]|uniref:hypothetical protein n=1 Tax=Roseibium sp. TaxID=1936156 RepID=UPI001B1197A7|nr:hypothetical protein [Roseibium sp.]MBO6858329.1 hypothetical protein [Roseibium sp.]
MSDRIKRGGSAFPLNTQNTAKPGAFEPQSGMSLRDWFAGQVLASAGALPLGEKDCNFRAKVAYEMADAMIRAREG